MRTVSGGDLNIAKCVEYLRYAGIEVSEARAEEWANVERDTRASRRRANAELKRSCGHFRTYDCKITSAEWVGVHVVCEDCHRVVREIPNTPTPPKGRKTIRAVA